MATVNFSVPEEVKAAFNAAFSGENKSAIIAELMRDAVDRVEARERSRQAVERILARRARAPVMGGEEIRKAREDGRS